MSELIHKSDNRAAIRWKLLTGASALALTAYVASAAFAKAEDADRPLIWIELGGQAEMTRGTSTAFTAPFMSLSPTPGPYHGDIFNQSPPLFDFGLEGKITFQAQDSDWILSAGIRYGRSNMHRHVHHQTSLGTFTGTLLVGVTQTRHKYVSSFADTKMQSSEKHTIMDFSAGRDVGLGLFGRESTSVIDMGVRYAQFSVNSALDINARPHVNLYYFSFLPSIPVAADFYQYQLSAQAARSFQGIGPSLSWNASAAIAGNAQDGELAIDWGINAALLFGRQKAKTSHSTTGYYRTAHGSNTTQPPSLYPPRHHHSARSQSVTVPNVGGFIGLSVKYPNAKLSVGYRYDAFLKAMDTGIDARKTSDVTFNGPYASISIGLGG